MPAQDPVSHRVKRPAPKSTRIDGQQIRDAIEHLPGGFVGEGEQQNISRIDSVLEQVRHAIGERARLPRARARDDKQRAGRRSHSRELLLIQFRRVIDVDRCGSWRALQRVLTGHNTCPTRTRLRCCGDVVASTAIFQLQVGRLTRSLSLTRPFGPPVYVAWLPSAPFTELPGAIEIKSPLSGSGRCCRNIFVENAIKCLRRSRAICQARPDMRSAAARVGEEPCPGD